MKNEILLIISLLVSYSSVVLLFRFLGKTGLFVITSIATILANIEVVILVHAFGMDQTLGNTLFASTFLATDILSEIYGKKQANKAVLIGIVTTVMFLIFSNLWVLYQPLPEDTMMSSVRIVFGNTPRILIASFVAYALSESFDVFVYHKWWKFTEKKFGNKHKMLWLRNNGSTLISQLINTVVFNFGAFYGIYELSVVISITVFGYIIYIITSLLDTPFVYLARWLYENKMEKSSTSNSN